MTKKQWYCFTCGAKISDELLKDPHNRGCPKCKHATKFVDYCPGEKKTKKKDRKKEIEKQIELCKPWVWAYYNQGINIIPIKYRSKSPNGLKKGEIEKWHYKRQPKDLIEKWLKHRLFENVAILGGEVSQNLICNDFDNPLDFKDLNLSPKKLIEEGAWVTETPKEPGRYHVVVQDRQPIKTTRKEKHIDYRANEHYWVVYPSVHKNGKRYNFLNTQDPAELELPRAINTLAMFEKWNAALNQKRGTKKKLEETVKTKSDLDKSPDCIRNAWELGAKPGMRYYVATALGSWLQQQKFPLEMATSIVMEWFKTKCETKGRSEEDIKKAVAVGYTGDKPYKTGCTFWRDKTLFCPYEKKEDCRFYNPNKERTIEIEGNIIEGTENQTDNLEERPQQFHNGFIGTIEQYYNERTNAPTAYATHLGIQLIGWSVGHNCAHNIQPQPIHHNTYLLLLGQSTLTRKTTAQDLAIDILPGAETFLLPTGFSPQGLLKALSGIPHGYLALGEFSSMLRGIKGSGNIADIKEILNELHRCPSKYEKKLVKMKDSFVIYNSYMSVSTTCTPEEYFSNLTDEIVYGGFMPRFIVVPGNSKYRPRSKLPKDTLETRKQIKTTLGQIYQLFVQPNKDYLQKTKISFEFTDEALKEFNRIDKMLTEDSQWALVKPFVGRYLDYIIVYADILFLSEIIDIIGINQFNSLTNLTNLTLTNSSLSNVSSVAVKRVKEVKLVNLVKLVNVTEENVRFLVAKLVVKQAWEIIKPCLEYTKEIVQYLNEDVKVGRLMSILEKHAPLQRSIAMQYSHLVKKDFNDAVGTLKERETVFELHVKSKMSDGRGKSEKKIYCTRKNIDTTKCKKCQFNCKYENRIPQLEGFGCDAS